MARWFLTLAILAASLPVHALELRVGPQPLERALTKQLFSAPDGRYYLHGSRTSACYLYAQHPQLHFSGNRIVLDLVLEGEIGHSFAGRCFGIHWAGQGELSMLPQAQGAIIGFTDVRVEHLTGNGELDQLLGPLIAASAPRSIHVNAAALLNKMLHTASSHSGVQITLDQFSLTNMQVRNNLLDLTLEGAVSVQ